MVTDAIKKLVKDTVFEEPLRDLYYRATKNDGYAGDLKTFEIMKKVLKKNSNCIDIGAHRGWILKKIIKYAPEGQHLAFEPIPEMFERLKQKFPNVKCFQNALSNQEGESIFHIVEKLPGYSGIKQSSLTNMPVKKINIKTQTLDNILKNYPQKIDFIKIDVEGAEGLVIEGGLDTITQNKPFIIFEFGEGVAKAYGTDSEKIHDLLCSKAGLKISSITDWIEGKKSLTLIDFKNKIKTGNYNFFAYQ